MSTISGIIVGIVVCWLVSSASRRFGENRKIRISESIAFGVLIGIICAIAPKAPAWFAMVFLLCDLLMMLYLVFWWRENGSALIELLDVGLVDLLLALVGCSAAARIVDITSARVAVGIVRVLPLIAFIISVGYFITNMIIFKEWLDSEEFDPDEFLDGNEKITDFAKKDSVFKKLRRWVNYENEVDFFDFSGPCNSSIDS